MGLTKYQQEQVRSHIKSKVSGGCPMCGQRNWNIESDLQFLGALDPEYRQPIEGVLYPLVTAVCGNCYYIAQFQAMRLGILA